MYGRTTRQPMGIGGGSFEAPKDIWILLAVIFVTFSADFLAGGIFQLLRLDADVWQAGMLWKLVTYAFIGGGQPGIFFILTLLILFWFSRDVFRYLGRRDFWRLILWGVGSASVAAVLVDLILTLALGVNTPAYTFMQGQTILMTVMIAAFATLYGNATILLFFVLPIQAKWFIGLEILIAFMTFLSTRDLASFVGICVSVGVVYSTLTGGGLGRWFRRQRLKVERTVLEKRLDRERKKRGFKVIKGGGRGGKGGNGRPDSDRWVH